MPNYATCTLVGHVGKDPELSFLPNKGTPILKFSICVTTGFGDKKQPTWWNCTGFGDRFKTLADMIHKGDPLMVTGEPSLRKYAGKNGDGQSLDVRVTDVCLLKGKREDAAPQQQAEPEPVDRADEIPF